MEVYFLPKRDQIDQSEDKTEDQPTAISPQDVKEEDKEESMTESNERDDQGQEKDTETTTVESGIVWKPPTQIVNDEVAIEI